MPIKNNNDAGPNPLPYCHIPKLTRSYNLNFDNCFSPQAKIQSPIFSPRRTTKSSLNVAASNESYPYYMPKEWFLVAPPMGIQFEEEEEEENENIDEIRKLSNLCMSVQPPLENLIGEAVAGGNKGRVTTRRGIRRHGPVEELSHRLERFKIKTLQVGGGGKGGGDGVKK